MFQNNNDDLVACPYDKAHRISKDRLAKHIIKCRVNFPNSELRKCFFNQTHLIPEHKFEQHILSCPDRKILTSYIREQPVKKEDEAPRKHAPVDDDENWDDEDYEDYNPMKYAQKANVIRLPVDTQPAQRKEFVKQERKRLGSDDDDDDDYASCSSKMSRMSEQNSVKVKQSPEDVSPKKKSSRK